MQRKEIEIISGTDMNLVGEVQQQYYDVLKILIDPQLDGLKSRIQVYVYSYADSVYKFDITSRNRRKSYSEMQDE